MSNEQAEVFQDFTKLYGLYIHNLTPYDYQSVALEAMNRFMTEVPPLKYQYGDVLVLQPNDDISDTLQQAFELGGYIVQRISPNRLYRLMDKIILHYVFVDKIIHQEVSEQHVYAWERDIGLSKADIRNTRYIKTFFLK